MKELGAANGLTDTFVLEQQKEKKDRMWEILQKQDNSHSCGDMMSLKSECMVSLPGCLKY